MRSLAGMIEMPADARRTLSGQCAMSVNLRSGRRAGCGRRLVTTACRNRGDREGLAHRGAHWARPISMLIHAIRLSCGCRRAHWELAPGVPCRSPAYAPWTQRRDAAARPGAPTSGSAVEPRWPPAIPSQWRICATAAADPGRPRRVAPCRDPAACPGPAIRRRSARQARPWHGSVPWTRPRRDPEPCNGPDRGHARPRPDPRCVAYPGSGASRAIRTASPIPPSNASPCPGSTRRAPRPSRRISDSRACA